jgi:protein phosphatase
MNLIDFNKDVYSVSDVGLVRKANEDNCYAAETPNGFLFVVCDGMGGHVGGARASAIAVNSIVNFFTKKYYAVVGQALEDALNFSNSQILGAAAEQPELKGMGTTACILLLRDDKAYFAHIGDSRIYLYCNKQQRLHRLTKDHSIVQGLVDQGVISETEAENHPNKNRILKTLGIKNDIQPDICTTPVLPTKDDVFLICSDGLSGMVNDELLQHILEQKVSLQEKGDNMLTFAKQAGGIDNITLQLILINNSPHTNSVFISKNSHYSTYSTNKKSKGNKLFIAITALFIVVVICSILFMLNPFQTKEDTQTTPPAAEKTSSKEKWEEKVSELKYREVGNDENGRVFGNTTPVSSKYFSGIKVFSDNSFFVGDILYTNNMYFTERDKGKFYYKNGNPK